MNAYTRDIDVGVAVGLAATLTVLAGLILLAHRLSGRDADRMIPAGWLYLSLTAFLFATAGLVAGRHVPFAMSAIWILCGTTTGIFSGFFAMMLMLDPSQSSRRWILPLAGVIFAQAALIIAFQRIDLTFLTSSAVNAALCLVFMAKVNAAARRSGFEPRLFLTLPFGIIALSYLARLGLLGLGTSTTLVVVASTGIAFILSFASVLWVFGVLSIQMHRMRCKMEENALRDALTGLSNRMALDAFMHDANKENAPLFFCICVDLDHFKAINDSLGHAAGDAALRQMARRLRRAAKSLNAAVFRVGGDEFVLFADQNASDNPNEFATDLLLTLCEPYRYSGQSMRAGASVGLAHGTKGQSLQHLMRHADLALYHAKQSGRARVVEYDGTQRMDTDGVQSA